MAFVEAQCYPYYGMDQLFGKWHSLHKCGAIVWRCRIVSWYTHGNSIFMHITEWTNCLENLSCLHNCKWHVEQLVLSFFIMSICGSTKWLRNCLEVDKSRPISVEQVLLNLWNNCCTLIWSCVSKTIKALLLPMLDIESGVTTSGGATTTNILKDLWWVSTFIALS